LFQDPPHLLIYASSLFRVGDLVELSKSRFEKSTILAYMVESGHPQGYGWYHWLSRPLRLS